MNAYIGTPTSRVDGRAKVTGTAKYAGEFKAEGLAHGFVVESIIAKGRIVGSPWQLACHASVYVYGIKRERSSRYSRQILSTCSPCDQGRCSRHTNPCPRKIEQNVLNWNQRTNSSGSLAPTRFGRAPSAYPFP